MNEHDVFELHPQLAQDCHLLGRFEHCLVLLHKNAVIPWFILVPETSVADLLDLPVEVRNSVMEECARIGRLLRDQWGVSKLNFGALGNFVPQMHLHIIGRQSNDLCWPKPVWGNLPESKEYSDELLAQVLIRLGREPRFITAAL